MTRSTAFITEQQQQEWFRTASDKYDLYLAYEIAEGTIIYDIGYGLVHKNKGESLLTGCLLPEQRNKGKGQELFKFLITQCDKSKPIKLEVLKTNMRAFIVYIKLGFNLIGEDDRLYFMEYQNDNI
ncbi:MAG: GNAT family N-acetyltransferase [Methylococcales bacterium]